jgi:hypothetical protein
MAPLDDASDCLEWFEQRFAFDFE